MLAWTIYISFLGAAALVLLPAESRRAARITALLTALAGLAAALGGAAQYERHAPSGALVDLVNVSWIADLGIRLSPGGGRRQHHAGVAHRHCGGGGRVVFVEHRAPHAGNFSRFIWRSSAAFMESF